MTAPAAGQRLRCASCGTEIIIVKAPSAPLSCCGQPMGARDEEAAGGQPAR
jgi:hypothetical protein